MDIFDTIVFISVGYTMDTMYFSWLPSPVDIDPNVQLPQFTLKDTIAYDCSQNYSAGRTPATYIEAKLKHLFPAHVMIEKKYSMIKKYCCIKINIYSDVICVSLIIKSDII